MVGGPVSASEEEAGVASRARGTERAGGVRANVGVVGDGVREGGDAGKDGEMVGGWAAASENKVREGSRNQRRTAPAAYLPTSASE